MTMTRHDVVEIAKALVVGLGVACAGVTGLLVVLDSIEKIVLAFAS